MTTTIAIGEPGHLARMILRNSTMDDAAEQMLPGEVGVEVSADDAGPLRISSSGDAAAPDLDQMAAFDAVLLRQRRTGLLQASDWTQVPDAPLSDEAREAWRLYRQELRNLPTSQPDATLETVEWPSPPENV